MKLEDVTVGMSVIYPYLGDEDKGIVTRIDGNKVWAIWHHGNEQYVSASSIEQDHVPTANPFLANTKINVQKYADTHGLTLEQGHQEIQPWLFEQGCVWGRLTKEVSYLRAHYLIINNCNSLTWTNNFSNFLSLPEKEITLLRNVSVSLSIAPPEPSVGLDGKQYTKAQLLEALAKLEGK